MSLVGARQMTLSRNDLRRREGARGEIATVEERLLRVNTILSRRLLINRRSGLWCIEQLRQQTAMQAALHPSPLTQAMRRTVELLDAVLWELDDLLTEARAETTGALTHLDEAVAALRIDLYYADRFKLQAAGLDEAQLDAVLSGERAQGAMAS
jgi:hypothetical protein